MKIKHVQGREIFDSRGIPALECELVLEDNTRIIASVPSGASRGTYEVVDIRDGGDRLAGRGLRKAIEIMEQTIAPLLIGNEPQVVAMDLKMLELDDSDNKQVLGGNVMLAASSALLKAQAYVEGLEVYELVAHLAGFDAVSLPVPLFNMINGGIHANNNLCIQEFMIVPVGERSFRACMEAGVEFFYALKKELVKRDKKLFSGDEGGFSADFGNEIEVLDILMEVISTLEQQQKLTFVIALDIAASQLYDVSTGLYNWHGEYYSSEELITLYDQLTQYYPIYSLEDGLSEYDWQGWSLLYSQLADKVQIVGDDLFVTNSERIWQGIQQKVANSVIIKPNQIGTITETLQAVKLCKEHGLNVIASHRSGETDDTLIADIAVGISAHQIKAGGLSHGERIAKYNKLLRIEDFMTHIAVDAD